MSMMLFLNDAMKVIKQTTCLNEDDLDILEQELEQKCWLSSKERSIIEIVNDINPQEIAAHVENDSLGAWCESWKAEILMRIKSI